MAGKKTVLHQIRQMGRREKRERAPSLFSAGAQVDVVLLARDTVGLGDLVPEGEGSGAITSVHKKKE